ncbi:MAG: hypothetical protein RLZZ251_670 [Actinomycetota bacterium]|jgi:hypothetical protein
MGSGLIYIIIVGMWISYFLPRWISNLDAVSGRSMERFASAMQVVASTTGKAGINIDEFNARRKSQLITRRILFLSIVGFTFLVSLFVLVGFITPVIITIPISTFALYLVHARHQMATSAEELALINSAAVMDKEKSRNTYRDLVARSKRATQQLTLGDEELWTPLEERKAKSVGETSGITILPKGNSGDRYSWLPTDVPAPTYSHNTKAPSRRRTIDLTIPGAWSAAHGNDAVTQSSDDEIFDQELLDDSTMTDWPHRAANE